MDAIANRLIVIAGPTAVGKSDFALKLASEINAEILSLDSVAVYRGLDIGSAKPSKGARTQIAHHLIDILEPNEQLNVASFVDLAHCSIDQIKQRGKSVVVVGGSTMYLTALLYGLADLPRSTDSDREFYAPWSTEDLFAELQVKDPLRAQKLHPNDRLRIERALISAISSDITPSEMIAAHGNRALINSALCFCLCLPREELYGRINQRSKSMIEAGLVEETKGLIDKFGIEAPALRSIGYFEVVKFLSGEFDLGQTEQEIAQNTRRFGKRQMTYWRNEPIKRSWVFSPQQVWPNKRGGKNIFPDFETNKLDWGEIIALSREFLSHRELGVAVNYITAVAD